MPTIDDAVAAYIKVRDLKAKLKKEQAEAMAPFNEKLEKIEAWLMRELNRTGVESARTDNGTAYKSHRTSTKVVDWQETLAYIRREGLWHMLERRVSKAAVEEFVEAQGAPPPGVTIVQDITVNVRR